MKSMRTPASIVCWVALMLLAGAAQAGIFYRAETTVQSSARSKVDRTTVTTEVVELKTMKIPAKEF